MSEFDNIEDLQGWTDKLSELLVAAKAAAQQEEFDPREAVSKRLHEFMANSPNTPEIGALDDIADQTASALMRQAIDDRLQSITERTGEFLKLSKRFASLAEENEAKASSIRLEAITSFLDSSIKVVDASKALLKSLKDDAGDKKLGEKIAETIAAVEALISSVGKRM